MARSVCVAAARLLFACEPRRCKIADLHPQLTERRKGNAAYQQRDFVEALQHYDRARAVVDFVKGISAADQAYRTTLWTVQIAS